MRLTSRFRLFATVVAIVAFAVVVTLSARNGSATSTTVGIDVLTVGNSATELGSTETCRRVEVGQSFEIDVWIGNVSNLSGWDLLLTFSRAQLTLEQVEFLFVTSLPINDAESGGQFLAAGILGSASGSGVLARVTFHAEAPGIAPLGIGRLHVYTTQGEILVGSVTPGAIAIGQDCGTITPPPTPSPTASPTPTLSPAPTPSPVPSPTGTPAPEALDVDCDNSLDTDDGLRILEHQAGVPREVPACPDVGDTFEGHPFGDLDCSGAVGSADALVLLLALSGVGPGRSSC